MRFLTDPPSPRRGSVAGIVLGVVAVLVLAMSWGPSDAVPREGPAGVILGAAVDADHATATADAYRYRRSDISRRPPLPAALAVVVVLVADAMGRHRTAISRAAPAPLLGWYPAWGSRAPPRLLV